MRRAVQQRLQRADRLVVAAQRVVDQCLVVVQFDRVLRQRLGLLQRRERLVVMSLPPLNLRDANLRLRVLRLCRHNRFEDLQRLIQLVVRQQRIRQPALAVQISGSSSSARRYDAIASLGFFSWS